MHLYYFSDRKTKILQIHENTYKDEEGVQLIGEQLRQRRAEIITKLNDGNAEHFISRYKRLIKYFFNLSLFFLRLSTYYWYSPNR